MDTIRKWRTDAASGVKSWVDQAFTPFYGRAQFVADKILEMEDGTQLTGDKIFIASGASPAIPPIPGLEEAGYWTNETVLEQNNQPESLIILGGGYIGCEFGHFFATLGTRVTVVDYSKCLLREDDDVRALFTHEFGKKVELILEAEATEAMQTEGQRGFVVKQKDGTTRTLLADALLVATGRRPNTETLALDKTGVESDDKGWVQVDSHLRTSHPDIYAYGDVIGQAMFKHTSSYEGELAYRNSQGASLDVSYRANPHAVFSDPQIGAVGLTERACQEAEIALPGLQKRLRGHCQGADYRLTSRFRQAVGGGRYRPHPGLSYGGPAGGRSCPRSGSSNEHPREHRRPYSQDDSYSPDLAGANSPSF
jgi:mycothione reductase